MTTIKQIFDFIGPNHADIKWVNEKNDSFVLNKPATISQAKQGDFAFLGYTAKEPQTLINQTQASLLLVDKKLPLNWQDVNLKHIVAIIYCDNSRLEFIKVLNAFFTEKINPEISSSAVIHPTAAIAQSVYIGSNSVIGAEVKIGENTIIHSNVTIYKKVTIGSNVIIHSGTVIGADGFGYEKQEDGSLLKFPHVGDVVIEDEVEIGANTCIDRGTIGSTLIRKGAKIDNLVHIAHNVDVGENATVIALAMVGGGTQIGKGAWISPSAVLRDRIKIGGGAVIGMGAMVTKNVPDNETWLGNPAKEISAFIAGQKKNG